MPSQLDLFGTAYNRARDLKALGARIRTRTYEAIVTLRKAGHVVHRHDTSHSVDGRRVDTHTLIQMAEACPKPTSTS